MKQVRIILSPEAEEVYKYLNENVNSKTEQMILSALNKKVELIKANVHFGEAIAKKLIPKEYIEKYGVNNLFRIELPLFWRMLYTLKEGESTVEIIAFVLDIIDHKNYNKKFGYQKN